MVIFYGGSAFSSSSTGANANTLQNAGTNVISAVSLARANGVSDFSTLLNNTTYLQDKPALPGGVGAATVSAAGVYTVAGVPAEVCTKVNENLGVTQDADLASATHKMGCTADFNFYAKG